MIASSTRGKGPLTCREMVELITAYLDGALSPLDRRRFEGHLETCDGCTAYLRGMRHTVTTLGGLSVGTISPTMRTRLLDAFRTWKDGAADGELVQLVLSGGPNRR